jgi:predicted nucleic acid-binding protein
MWFALIKQEPGRFARCRHIVDRAKRGEVEIWTSTLTLAEVFRKQCGGTEAGSLPADKDQEFEDFLAQDFVIEVQLDRPIGVQARRLLRAHAALKKPQDAAHLASAVWHNLDEFHTFDQVNLLCLNGSINTRGGSPLKICEPPEPPVDLFTELTPIEVAAAAAPALAAVEVLAAVLPPAAIVAAAASAPPVLLAAEMKAAPVPLPVTPSPKVADKPK